MSTPRTAVTSRRCARCWPSTGERIYAEVDTPSGGKHFDIKGHPDLPTVHSKADNPKLPGYPGLDIQSHGANVFTPPTMRPKYGYTGYSIVFDELDQLAPGEDDDGGTGALTDWVAEQLRRALRRRRARHPAVPVSGPGIRASRGTGPRPTGASRRTCTRRCAMRPPRSRRPARAGATTPSSKARSSSGPMSPGPGWTSRR